MFILRCCSTMSSVSFIVMIISQPHALRENVPTGSTCSSVSHGNGSGRPVRKNTSWLIGQSAKTSKALHFHRPIQKKFIDSLSFVRCLNEYSFVCRSVSYDGTSRTCSLSRFTRRTHPEFYEDDPGFDYLENTCLSGKTRRTPLILY